MGEHTSLYRFYDEADELLYVGITNSVPRRLDQHESDKPWFAEAARVTIEHFPDRASALAAEKVAIQSECPRFNVVHNTAVQVVVQQPRPERRYLPMEPSNGVTAARWNTNRVHTVGFLDRDRSRKFSELLAAASEYFAYREQQHEAEPYLIRGVNYRMGGDGVWIFEVEVTEIDPASIHRVTEEEAIHAEILRAMSRLGRLERRLRPADTYIPEGWPLSESAG